MRCDDLSPSDKGVKFARPAALTPHQRQEALERLGKGEVQADVARTRPDGTSSAV